MRQGTMMYVLPTGIIDDCHNDLRNAISRYALEN
jgi:hypothetical protein